MSSDLKAVRCVAGWRPVSTRWAWLVGAGLLLVGCASPPNPLQDIVTQFSSTSYLRQHPRDAQVAVTNLPAYGNLGVGVDAETGQALAWMDGQCYRLTPASAQVQTNTAAWAVVTFFDTNLLFDVGDMNTKVFQRTMDWKKRTSNDVTAVRVDGVFRSVTLLESPLQEAGDTNAPPPVTLSGVAGTLVGFRSPVWLGGVAPGGYYLHFIDRARARGGCVTGFDLAQGRVLLDPTGRLQLVLPREADAGAP